MISQDNKFVHPWVAGYLLAFAPATQVNRYADEHPAEFPNSRPGVCYSLSDLTTHKFRKGKPITAAQLQRAENLHSELRATWSRYKRGDKPGRMPRF